MKAIKSIQKVMMLLAAAAVLTSGPLFAATLYFPHVISGEVWETEICIINSDAAQPLSGTLRAFGDDGQEAAQSHSVTLPANGRAELKVGDLFLQPQNIGYLVLETDSAGFTGYSRFYISGRYSASVPAAAEAGGGDIFISHIASDENWWTRISLVNTTEASKEITFEFNDGSAADWTLPAKGRASMTAAQLFGGQMPEGVESAAIKNADGVVGLEIFGSHDSSGSSYLGSILLKNERTGTLYFPHIASDANWWSGIAVFNPGEAGCDLTITPYAADGTALTTQTAEIGPFGRYIGLVSSLNLPPQAAWVKVDASSPVTGFELFGTQSRQQLAGYSGVSIAAKAGVFAKTETDGWMGFAFVNIENDPADIALTAYDNEGNWVASGEKILAAYEKSADFIAGYFSGAGISAASYVRYSSENNIVGFQLNSSGDNMLLDGLPGLALETTGQTADDDETAGSLTYPVVDTGQIQCFSATGQEIACPSAGASVYGQDAQHTGNAPSYTDNGDGTVTDNITGLMWTRSPDLNGDGTIDADDKLTYGQAVSSADGVATAGYTDWRLPSIKELYSLILFSGYDVSGYEGSTAGLIPFIDTDAFAFGYGDESAGERIIDSQWATSTKYVSTTMNGSDTMFGVNFADGRIKGYGYEGAGGEEKTFYVIYVRGNTDYGQNAFTDNGDGTVTDRTTGLMWTQNDSGEGMNWEEALAWTEAKNAENYLGYSGWRLPDAKELQSIVDYTRSPDTTGSAAIDPVFSVSSITNEAGQPDFPCFWSGTTHANMGAVPGANAAYVAFGRAMGYMNGQWIDVHGAGAQRSDPKVGDPADYPAGHGPQGDAIRIYNYVRLVRDADVMD